MAAIPPTLAQAALAAKRLAFSNRRRRQLVLLVCLALGWLGFFAYTALVRPMGIGSLFLASVLGVALGVFIVFKRQAWVTPALAACPRCARSWEFRVGRHARHAERMPSWEKCIGCGLPMQDDLLKRLADGRAPGKTPR